MDKSLFSYGGYDDMSIGGWNERVTFGGQDPPPSPPPLPVSKGLDPSTIPGPKPDPNLMAASQASQASQAPAIGQLDLEDMLFPWKDSSQTSRGFRMYNFMIGLLVILMVILIVRFIWTKPWCLGGNEQEMRNILLAHGHNVENMQDRQFAAMDMQMKAIASLNKTVNKLDSMLAPRTVASSTQSDAGYPERIKGPREHFVNRRKPKVEKKTYKPYVGGSKNSGASFPMFDDGPENRDDGRVKDILDTYKRSGMMREAFTNTIRADAVRGKDYAPNYDLFDYI